jgi:hypothetical protein
MRLEASSSPSLRLPAISVAHHDDGGSEETGFPRGEDDEEDGPLTPYSLYSSLPPSTASSPHGGSGMGPNAAANNSQFVFPASSSAYQFSTATPTICLSPNEISR